MSDAARVTRLRESEQEGYALERMQNGKAPHSFGERVEYLRRKAGYVNASDFARKAQISPQQLNDMEKSGKDARLSTVLKVAAALELPVSSLVFGLNTDYDVMMAKLFVGLENNPVTAEAFRLYIERARPYGETLTAQLPPGDAENAQSAVASLALARRKSDSDFDPRELVGVLRQIFMLVSNALGRRNTRKQDSTPDVPRPRHGSRDGGHDRPPSR